jgi:hypothetical protein
MKLLGNGITLTITAARVEQLYDFEDAIVNAGVSPAELQKLCSVLHNIKNKAKRPSDANLDVPILMVTQARIRDVYRRPEERKEKDLAFFLKYRDEPRDLVIWDERASVTEPVSLKLSELKQALASLKAMYGESEAHRPFAAWLEDSLGTIAGNISQYNAKDETALPPSEGFVSELPKGNLQTFYTLLTQKTPNLNWALRKTLVDFMGLLQFRLRVLPMQGHEGLITYFVIIPDGIENCLVLDASYSTSELTKADATIQDLEQAHPTLLDMKSWYGKNLKDLKDCSEHTILYWNTGAGKDKVEHDLTAYLDGKAIGGNIILEVVEQVKRWMAEGKAVLLWTHKFGGSHKDLTALLRQALGKGGVDLSSKVQDKFSRNREWRDQVIVENYGKHDASNAYSYCEVVAHVGVQRRSLTELSASFCGAKRDLGSRLVYQQIRSLQTTDAVATLQQSNGRGQSRITVAGKALPQTSWFIFSETKEQSLTKRLKPLNPGATWVEYQPLFAQASEPTLVDTWSKVVLEYLDSLPMDQKKISGKLLKSAVGGSEVADATWKRIIDTAVELTSMDHRKISSMSDGSKVLTHWKREGRSLVRVDAELFGLAAA